MRQTLSRRAYLQGGTLMLAGNKSMAQTSPQSIRFGLFTDVHHADKPEVGTRYYRESLTKLEEGLATFRKSKAEFLVCLGDLVDAARTLDEERALVAQAMGLIRGTQLPVHFVLGNHCVQTLTKQQFLEEAKQKRSYYSFERGGVHFVVLDACYRKDGVSYDAGNFDWKDTEIPAAEQSWLQQDLAASKGPVLVFVHQRLDVEGVHAVASAREVRAILERSGKVAAVFQGHSHQNDYREIDGIHYCTMRAVIEGSGAANNGYALITLQPDGSIALEGFRAQRAYQLVSRAKTPSSK